jgi:hypothetical protein
LITSVLGWTTSGIGGWPESRLWFRWSGVVFVPSLVLLLWADLRRETLPDFLKGQSKRRLETNGFCFVVGTELIENQFHLTIAFQSRCTGDCNAIIGLRPTKGRFGIRRPEVGDLELQIYCPGAAFGVAAAPYGVPKRYQGEMLRFEVIASARYPNGKGRMIRYRDGSPVASAYKSGIDAVILALGGLVGHHHYRSSTTLRIHFPMGIPEIPAGIPFQEIRWTPSEDPNA